MAHKKGVAKTPLIIKKAVWGAVGVIILFFVIVPIFVLWQKITPAPVTKAIVSVDYPLCAGGNIYDLRRRTTQVNLQLHPTCWSGWVMLPEGGNYSAVVDTLSPGDLEYKFWNGERILIPDKSVMADISSGRNYGSAYRLRGYGEAIITKKEVI